jgi:hypothetical protein
MTRRELIQKTALSMGYALTAPSLSVIMSACEQKHQLAYKPVFFNAKQATVIGDLAEMIIPKTDTPGAIEAGVPMFIDTFIKEVYSKEEQERFIKELDEFDLGTIDQYFRSFMECTPDLQLLYVQRVHDSALKGAAGVSEGWWYSGKADRPFILKVKELTILGFFSSEVGATQVLQYNPSPGRYRGCVPLEDIGRAWAS